ncbi:MAG TPA: ABC transporter substrate-binding protein, partial [Polyangiaceae bacterium]|nr:ABC transporter substrate-binding protein [Polyangiaceae bacterium]
MKLRQIAALIALMVAAVAPARAETTIHIALVRSVSNGAELIALDRGYFKEAGLNVVIDDIDTSASTMVLLAQNRLQIIAGGVSAGYFNAILKGMPVTIIADRVSTPIGHDL